MLRGYIPFDWKNDFDDEYLKEIKYYCLVMTREYIEGHFDDIKKYASAIEDRIDDSWCTKELVLEDNACNLEMCKKYNCNCLLIDERYQVDVEL